jgi:hypothetical protein
MWENQKIKGYPQSYREPDHNAYRQGNCNENNQIAIGNGLSPSISS